MNEYKQPGQAQGNNKTGARTPNEAGSGLEKKGPNKKGNQKVLHKDGSLADLPDVNEPGGGALDGIAGIGS